MNRHMMTQHCRKKRFLLMLILKLFLTPPYISLKFMLKHKWLAHLSYYIPTLIIGIFAVEIFFTWPTVAVLSAPANRPAKVKITWTKTAFCRRAILILKTSLLKPAIIIIMWK